MPENATHFLTITYKLQEFQAAPLTDPITAHLTVSSLWVAKAPSTWKSHWFINPLYLALAPAPKV